MVNSKKVKKYVRYANFHTANAATKYTLLVDGYTSTLNNGLKHHNRQKFSTFDSNDDVHFTTNCASLIFRAWWFNGFNPCQYSHLNGKYNSGGKMSFDTYSKNIVAHSGIHWYSNGFSGDSDSLIFTEMKVRRKL